MKSRHPKGGVVRRLGRCGSKSRFDFPSEEILLDSLLALLFEETCPLVIHTDFSKHHPSLRRFSIALSAVASGRSSCLVLGARPGPLRENDPQRPVPAGIGPAQTVPLASTN
jgi:hypothetical protein